MGRSPRLPGLCAASQGMRVRCRAAVIPAEAHLHTAFDVPYPWPLDALRGLPTRCAFCGHELVALTTGAPEPHEVDVSV